MGQRDSWRFVEAGLVELVVLEGLVPVSASLRALEKVRRVGSMSEKPLGGGLRLRGPVRVGGIVAGEVSRMRRSPWEGMGRWRRGAERALLEPLVFGCFECFRGGSDEYLLGPRGMISSRRDEWGL